jgi:superfamily II DNA or RNA helicase
MPEQSTSTVCGMSFRKKPRDGQREVFEKVYSDQGLKSLNIQLPTGYGKSLVNSGVYSILKKQNRVNRLLIIVPTKAQNEQYHNDGPYDMEDVGLEGCCEICDIGYFNVNAFKMHKNGKKQIFLITIQSLIANLNPLVMDMMQTGEWMVTVDEYHHYGENKAWGDAVKRLPYSFLLAMSATPHRKENDGAFGVPDIVVSYRYAAIEEECLKPLVAHSYTYKVDALKENGDIVSMTTDELLSAVGSDSPDAIENHLIKRKMRWSPKYIYPLVKYPIERMRNERIKTGHKLQAILGAMCVSHAKLICEQVSDMFPEFKIDWVGTGSYGRGDEKNKNVIEQFCPPKNSFGDRSPQLDVLVHVGMAGEGLDSINVSEVVHLNNAAINNSNNQENGRAARFLPGVIGHINFDSSSEYAQKDYIGDAIMDAMDSMPPTQREDEIKEVAEADPMFEPLPEKMGIQIWNMELKKIDSGSADFKNAAEALITFGQMSKKQDFKWMRNEFENNRDSDFSKMMIALITAKEEFKMEKYNERSATEQCREQVNDTVNKISGRIEALLRRRGVSITKNGKGRIIASINIRKKGRFGAVKSADLECLNKQFDWLKALDNKIIETRRPPSWIRYQ